MRKITVLGISLGAALLCAVPVSLQWSPLKTVSISVDKAEARIGRPLTPGSVAGVHRRVERRTYRRGVWGCSRSSGEYYHGRHCGYYPYPPCY